MKRSDAIKLIQNKLSKYNSEHYSYDSTSHAKEILAELEKEAMKPIGYYGLIASGKKYNQDTDQGRDVEFFRNWEPEDD
jgi:hypothetical protein